MHQLAASAPHAGVMPQPASNRLAYSMQEAAKQIGISRQRLYELVDAGEIESVKLGGRRLIRETALIALLERHTVRA